MSATGMLATVLASQLAKAAAKDQAGEGQDISAGLFGYHTSDWLRQVAAQLAQTAESKCRGTTDGHCNYLATCGGPCNKCGRVHDGRPSPAGGISVKHIHHDRADGLVHCKVCNGAEASLPTECPGRKMTAAEEDAVSARVIDYRHGAWGGGLAAQPAAPDYFAAVRGKRLSELTPAQREDAHELWLRDQLGWMTPYNREHYDFLLKRLDEARQSIKLLEEARPHWAQGHTSDGVAAQVTSAALTAIWQALGVSNQTEAMDVLRAMTPAARDALAERRRQIEQEGWDAYHDDMAHDQGDLAAAGSAYALAAADKLHPLSQGDGDFGPDNPPPAWPWDDQWWKPGEPRRMLVKAGALILAEIERLDRAAKEKA